MQMRYNIEIYMLRRVTKRQLQKAMTYFCYKVKCMYNRRLYQRHNAINMLMLVIS